MSKVLLEIGCEEIPARFLNFYLNQLSDLLMKLFEENRLFSTEASINKYGTYRRLSFVIDGVLDKQDDINTKVFGPPLSIAKSDNDEWQSAAVGFAKKNGCSVDDASLALEALAKLHRTFWGGKDLGSFDWLPDINNAGMKVGREVYAQSLPGFLEAFGSSVHPENEGLVERFGENVHQLLDRLAAMPLTVCHMDYS